jgi:hypothetical protein
MAMSLVANDTYLVISVPWGMGTGKNWRKLVVSLTSKITNKDSVTGSVLALYNDKLANDVNVLSEDVGYVGNGSWPAADM